ncbi:MAG: helix-turn-helix transcriptional regulator [Pyrobaculum sp.]
MLDDTKVRILSKIAQQGYITINEVVKEMGLSWGAAQWHLFWLENNGYIKSAKVDGVTFYVLNCINAVRKLEAVEKTLQKRRTGA